jgi:hypothetical protein
MAYMSQENKKELAPSIKAVLKKYGMKGSIGVRHHSGLVVNIKSGVIDVAANVVGRDGARPFNGSEQVNEFHLDSLYSGKLLSFLQELKAAMTVGNWDKSDYMTDYFNIGWYIWINIGQWDKPYVFDN